MIEDLGVRLRADGVVEASNGVNLTGKAIEDLGKKADAAAPAMARTGKTAKETAAAMRLLPAQITDITTSLASGQPAWLVAIQQGGQIKDSFGGIGPAATALRAAISPLALALGGAAVAGGALVAAMIAGSRESAAFTQAITLSGNAAGVTEGRLNDMAAAIGNTVGTQHQAAAALAQLTASGQVGQRGMQQFAETAVRMERVTGQSVEDTVKAFADLGRAPLQASIRLNESLNYLTVATYNHISALVEQKKMTEAAAAAQKAYADAMNPRLETLQSNVGFLERAWRGAGDAAKWAWDKMLGIGREASLAEKIAAARAEIAKMEGNLDSAPKNAWSQLARRDLDERRAELGIMLELQKIQDRAATIRADEAAAVKSAIAADQERKRAVKPERDKLTDAQREAIRLQQEADRSFAAGQQQAIDLLRSRAEAAERDTAQIRASNEALADQTAEMGLSTRAIQERTLAKNREKIAEAEQRLATIAGLDAYEREADALRESIAALKERGGLLATNFAKTNVLEEAKANQERTDAIAASIEEGVLNGFRDGRKASAAFLREIQAQFLRAALKLPIQMLAQAGNDVMGGLLKLVGGFFGAAGGSPNGAQGGDYGVFFHGGGVGAGEAAFSRRMPAATWRGAPRFHGGMGPGELPAVIKNDEGVFTKGQMKALAPVSALAAAAPVVNQYTTINIDSRTDRAEVVQLVARGMQAAQANLLDKLNRKQV